MRPSTLEPKLLAISLLAAILLVSVLYLIRRRSQSRANSIVFVGAPDAGKTAILSTLAFGQTLPSHTSLQTNMCTLSLNKKTITLVDIPGHPRLRAEFREHLPNAKAVVFVVDSSDVSRNGPLVAEHLHWVLHAVSSIPPSQEPPAILILAHKCDLLKTGTISTTSEQLATNRVRAILERELEKRRRSHTGSVAIDELGAEGEDNSEWRGLDCNGALGESFKFSEWGGGDIEFMGTWVSAGDMDGKRQINLAAWLEALA